MVWHYGQDKLQKKEYMFIYHSRGIKVNHGREAWQQATGMQVGIGSRKYGGHFSFFSP